MTKSFPRGAQLCLLTSFMLLLAIVSGCRPTGPATGEVSGTVSYKGQPLPTGTVIFVGPDKRIARSLIKDGSYKIRDAPVGQVTIGVASHPFVPPALQRMQPGQPSPPVEGPDDPYLPLPLKYKDPEQSGQTYTVHEGQQTFNITLK